MLNDEKLDLLLINMQELKGEFKDFKKEIKEEVNGIKEEVKGIKEEVNDIKEEVKDIKKDVQQLKDNMEEVNDRIKNIEMTLENETNNNIRVIAEGHLNLDRKLDEALKSLQPNMMYQLKVNYLDSEVKKIKPLVGLK